MSVLAKVTSFFFPVTCSGCGKDLPADDTERLCAPCRSSIRLIEGLFCQTCGLPLPDGGAHCYDCRNARKRHFETHRSAAVYEGTLRDLIHRFKYRGRDYLARPLGKFLVELFSRQPYASGIDAIVPVPMHWLKEYVRGYNQAALLARELASSAGKPLLPALRKRRLARAQFSLNRRDRARNIEGIFAVRNNAAVRRKAILLIDDVCTTCATLDECARVLRHAGAARVYALTVARD